MYKYDFSGTLGMTEAEVALSFMLDDAERKKLPFCLYSIHITEIARKNEILSRGTGSILIGFAWMLSMNLVLPTYPNGTYGVSTALIELMRKKSPYIFSFIATNAYRNGPIEHILQMNSLEPAVRDREQWECAEQANREFLAINQWLEQQKTNG